jgi:hypothetical protein
MNAVLFRFVVLAMARTHRRRQNVTECLVAEKQVLRERLGGRPRLTDD